MKQVSSKNKSPEIRIRITVLLRREDGKICFVRHNKNGKIYWLLPGGGQDAMETALDAARRELHEELRIAVEGFKFVFARESMDPTSNRHIQFLVFEGTNPDFSTLAVGDDKRVVGFDFFNSDEIMTNPIYPAMKEDIVRFAENREIEPFKTLEWIP